MDQCRVEVRGLNGAFYEAHIKSVSGNMLAVVYENNPQLEFFVSCDSVWPPPPPHSTSCEMSVGDEVEIYSRNSDGEPFGWWLATIRMMIGEWCLIEYAAGGQEFVLPESIRPFNPNRFCSVETLVRSYCSEEQNVRLQVPENCREEAERKDQPGQAGVGDTVRQPAGGAGHRHSTVTDSRSRSLNSLSNEGHSSQPSDSGEHAEANGVCTEESWLSEGGRQVEARSSKVSKSTRRRRNRHKPRLQYTLKNKYDVEEIRLTPQGSRLFRLLDSRWVEMA